MCGTDISEKAHRYEAKFCEKCKKESERIRRKNYYENSKKENLTLKEKDAPKEKKIDWDAIHRARKLKEKTEPKGISTMEELHTADKMMKDIWKIVKEVDPNAEKEIKDTVAKKLQMKYLGANAVY